MVLRGRIGRLCLEGAAPSPAIGLRGVAPSAIALTGRALGQLQLIGTREQA
jgi:hypothetical protein